MRVDPNNEPLGVADSQAARTRRQDLGVGKDQLAIGGSKRLLQALKQIPEVRAEKVAQARLLIQDPAYPSDQVLGKVSSLLADTLRDQAKSP